MNISSALLGTSFVGHDGAVYVVTGFDSRYGHMCMRITQCWYVDDIEITPIDYSKAPYFTKAYFREPLCQDHKPATPKPKQEPPSTR